VHARLSGLWGNGIPNCCNAVVEEEVRCVTRVVGDSFDLDDSTGFDGECWGLTVVEVTPVTGFGRRRQAVCSGARWLRETLCN
jgi:hypothetical protein